MLEGEVGVAGAGAPSLALFAQALEGEDTAFVAGAAGFDSLAQPGFFEGELLFEGGAGLGLDFEGFLLALEIGLVVATEADDLAEIDLDDAGGELAEEGAVVGDEEESEFAAEEEVFEPEDGLYVEMVGRFVEDEHAWLDDEGSAEEGAALEAS